MHKTSETISSWKANSITGCTRPSPTSLRKKLRRSRGFGVADVAIDRFMGKVLDKQIEVVNE